MYNIIYPKLLTPINLAASANSTEIDCTNFSKVGYSCTWSGSDVTGTLIPQILIQADSDNPLTVDYWIDLNVSMTISGSASSQAFDIDVSSFQKIRLKYTKSSGTAGTLSLTVMAKG